MLKIEIAADSVRRIVTKDDKKYTLQAGYVHTLDQQGRPHPHPVRAEWFVGRDEQPAAPGVYLLAPASIYVDRSGRLAVAPKLVPAPAGK
jgi:hypothetical protein